MSALMMSVPGKAADMTAERSTENSGLFSNGLLRSFARRTGARHGRELPADNYTDIRLREALAREDALLRQNDALVQRQNDLSELFAGSEDATNSIAHLTPRERQIMEMVLAGHPSKNIAADLGINQRTVENHRASIMRKTGAKSIPALVRIALAAFCKDALGTNT